MDDGSVYEKYEEVWKGILKNDEPEDTDSEEANKKN